MPNYTYSRTVTFRIYGLLFTFERELVSQKSEKLSQLLNHNPQQDISHLIRDIPAVDHEALEVFERFCHDLDVKITSSNVIQVSCLAHYFQMTENQFKNNLIKKSLMFLEQTVLPSWGNCLKALISAENVLDEAVDLRLIDVLAESIIMKAVANPILLGEPLRNEDIVRRNTKRRLFVEERVTEDLTALSLQLYEPIIQAMIQRNVPLQYVSASLYSYLRTHVFSSVSNCDNATRAEVVEAIERAMPEKMGLFSCEFLFELLRVAVDLEASMECRKAIEGRIGKQLDQAKVKDLIGLFQGYYGKFEEFDATCLKRILKAFYLSVSGGSDVSGLIKVAKLVEGLLLELASADELSINTFTSVAEMVIAASEGSNKISDNIYRAIDVYLDTHKDMTDAEKEEVCGLLDFNKMSTEACEHAVQNSRLPARVVLHVMLMRQIKLRESTVASVERSQSEIEESETEPEKGVRREIEEMKRKVMELERVCGKMKKEIEVGKDKNVSVWREMKRKFGCITLNTDCNFQSKNKKKKIHPK